MNGYRKLKPGEIIKEGDGYFINNAFNKYKKCVGYAVCDSDPTHYRPIPAKKVVKWNVWESCDHKYIIGDKDHGERARVWSLKDARLICKAVNKYLGA